MAGVVWGRAPLPPVEEVAVAPTSRPRGVFVEEEVVLPVTCSKDGLTLIQGLRED